MNSTSEPTKVITNQPEAIPPPVLVQTEQPVSCRPGFEPFLNIDHVFVKQKRTDFLLNDANEFDILGPNKEKIFTARETTDGMERLLRARRQQTFTLQIGSILTLKGDIGNLCNPAVLLVFCGRQPIGSVVQIGNKFTPEYIIKDRQGVTGISIETIPCSNFCGLFGWCCNSLDIYDNTITDGSGKIQIGAIGKQFNGLVSEVITNADRFVVQFPAELDVVRKALVLCTAILIDFQFFEAA